MRCIYLLTNYVFVYISPISYLSTDRQKDQFLISFPSFPLQARRDQFALANKGNQNGVANDLDSFDPWDASGSRERVCFDLYASDSPNPDLDHASESPLPDDRVSICFLRLYRFVSIELIFFAFIDFFSIFLIHLLSMILSIFSILSIPLLNLHFDFDSCLEFRNRIFAEHGTTQTVTLFLLAFQ